MLPSTGAAITPTKALTDKPAHQASTEHNPIKAAWETVFPDSISLFTAALFLATIALWLSTRKLWLAGEKQLAHSEGTAKRQLRAYVTTEDHDIIGFWQGGPATLRTKIWNRGQTPAYDVKVWSIVTGTQDEPDDLKIKQRKKEGFAQSRAMLGPGQWVLHTNGCQGPLDAQAYKSIVWGGLKLVFAGVVSYRDIFGKRHFTIFKQFYAGDGDFNVKIADLLACGRGNNGN